jgi:hypothetical protein
MRKFILIPCVGVGDVKFGDSRETVRLKLGSYSEFKKTNTSENTSDDFGYCHAFYNKDDICTAIEFFNENITLEYEEQSLFAQTYENLKGFILSKDNEAEIDSYGIISKILQIGVSCDGDIGIEAILVGKDGYYD